MSLAWRILLVVLPVAVTACSHSEKMGSASEATIVVRGASGKRGQLVTVQASLTGGAGVVSATATDIAYDPARVSVARTETGKPDCTINQAIGAETGPEKGLQSKVLSGTSAGGEVLRVAVLGFNTTTIPDGPLFSCRFQVADAAPAGAVTLQNVADGSDPAGNRIAVRSQNATIVVEP